MKHKIRSQSWRKYKGVFIVLEENMAGNWTWSIRQQGERTPVKYPQKFECTKIQAWKEAKRAVKRLDL